MFNIIESSEYLDSTSISTSILMLLYDDYIFKSEYYIVNFKAELINEIKMITSLQTRKKNELIKIFCNNEINSALITIICKYLKTNIIIFNDTSMSDFKENINTLNINNHNVYTYKENNPNKFIHLLCIFDSETYIKHYYPIYFDNEYLSKLHNYIFNIDMINHNENEIYINYDY